MRCLDTTFLVDFLRGNTTITARPGELCTSAINVFEVYMGVYALRDPTHRDRELKHVDQLFNTLEILPLTSPSAQQAAEIAGTLIREGKQIDEHDAITAAVALAHGVSAIYTRNVSHFKLIPGITVEEH